MRLTRPRPPHDTRAGSFLARLLRDRKANTLVIMAIALIPISGLAGSAVDMARLYVVKARLQQACDAGVLAGRKYMTVGPGALDATATARANEFFRNNMEEGWLRTGRASFTPTKTSDNQVAGTASVLVPMTVMKMFAAPDRTLNVACQARYDVADTDIIFVLDTTGSMACRPEDNSSQCNNYVGSVSEVSYTRPSDSYATAGYQGSTGYAVPETTAGQGSRIKALRQAVKDFYATMDASKDANTRVRYGFVTYTSTVNAGRAIVDVSPNYIVGGRPNETAPYQSRQVTGEYQESSSTSTNSKTRANCTASNRNPAATAEQLYTFATNRRATLTTEAWDSGNSRCVVTTKIMGPIWTYKQWDLPVSDYVTRSTAADPTKLTGATSAWDGCIEERATEAGRYTFTSASFDLDPDLIPTTSNDDTRWKPMWPDAIYLRNSNATMTARDENNANSMGTADYRGAGYVSCGKPIRRLSEMSAAQVAAYVDAVDFRPIGGTYHDTGMIWGTRLLSTTGIFNADNTGRAGQARPKKVIVFLTDGDMAPSTAIYGLYGYESYDRRVSGGDFSNLKAYHNARFLAECDKARTAGVDVWTVAIGLASTAELKSCARTDAQALSTTSGSGLSSAFQTIAKQVAMLRLQQ